MTITPLVAMALLTTRAMASDCRGDLPPFPVHFSGEFVLERSDGAACSDVFRAKSYTVQIDKGENHAIVMTFHSDEPNPFLRNVVMRGWMDQHCQVKADKMIGTGDGTSVFLNWTGPVMPDALTARVTAQVEKNGYMVCTSVANFAGRDEN